MLHTPGQNRVDRASALQLNPPSSAVIEIKDMLGIARRQAWLLVLGAVAGLALGGAYVFTAVPLYTVSADILLDKGKAKIVDELSGASASLLDEADILSQVELLSSEQLAGAVSGKLKLADSQPFLAGTPSLMSLARGGLADLAEVASDKLLGDSFLNNLEKADSERNFAQSIDVLKRNLDVSRVGKTYILNLRYTSADPTMAYKIVQTYSDAYLDDQLQAKYDATKRASGWLQDRIAELKQQSFAADSAVQRFRAENGLISAGGQLVSEQQLSEINSQLTIAQAATAEAKARMDQIQALIDSGRTDVVVGDALVSQTINQLRQRYLDASRRETEISNKLGPDHIQAVRLRAEMEEVNRLIFGEMRRIAESYDGAYQIALSRQKSLEASLAASVGKNTDANETQVRLRELERESATFRSLYDNFLERYQQTVQQQSFPITEARVITPATFPDRPSFPKKPLILALFMVMGIASTAGIALLREFRERFFRTGDQVRGELGVEYLGAVPRVDAPEMAKARETISESGMALWRKSTLSAYARYHPMSAFAETLRNVKVAADMELEHSSSKVLGVISCLPSEGKSTLSANLATLFTMQGARVLLIDGDMRDPGLTRTLETRPESGLLEVILGSAEPEKSLIWDKSGRLAILPTVLKRSVSHTSELLASPSMGKLIDHFRSSFDYILIDLPPVGPVVDAKAFAHRVDRFVVVVEWGRTARQLVRSILLSNPVFHNKCLGVILNKMDESKMKLYRSYGSAEYYSSEYGRYTS